jgi:hypothetical protein
MRRAGTRWSAAMYVWHLLDVLRIGTERLLTLSHDPGRGITCWDENALARDRRYHQLSPVVGLIAFRSAAREWVTTAQAAPAAADVRHPSSACSGRWRSSAVTPTKCTITCGTSAEHPGPDSPAGPAG